MIWFDTDDGFRFLVLYMSIKMKMMNYLAIHVCDVIYVVLRQGYEVAVFISFVWKKRVLSLYESFHF